MDRVFPNDACVVSLVDRIIHNAEVIALEGESYRLKEAQQLLAVFEIIDLMRDQIWLAFGPAIRRALREDRLPNNNDIAQIDPPF